MTPSATTNLPASRDLREARRGRRLGAVAVSSCLLGLLGVSGLAHAQDTTTTAPGGATGDTTTTAAPAPDTGAADPSAPVAVPSSFSLPLFGVPLTVDITTGPGGNIAGVALNPADGFTATVNRPNKVAFVNDDGTAKVVVRSNGGGQRVEARAGSLDAFVGQPGGWNGEIFPGVPASVAFDITGEGGVPDIVLGEITGPYTEVGEVEHSEETDDEGEFEHEASVRIQFAQDGMRRTLTIKVEVETDDGETKAKLRISLSRLKSEPFSSAAVGVEQTWTGVLCDNTPASIAYTIGEDGSITLGAVSPEPARTKAEGNSVEVRFAAGERVRLTVRQGDGGLAVKVNDKIRCADAPDPTLNVPVQDDDDNDHDGEHDDDHGRERQGNGGNRNGNGGNGGNGGKDRRGHDDDDDDATTTTVTTAAPVDTVAGGDEDGDD